VTASAKCVVIACSTGRVARTFVEVHTGADSSCWSIAARLLSTGNLRIAVGSNAHQVAIWDVDVSPDLVPASEEKCPRQVICRSHNHNIPSVDLDELGDRLASASIDGSVIVWDASLGTKLFQYQSESLEWGWCVRWIPSSFVHSSSSKYTRQVILFCTETWIYLLDDQLEPQEASQPVEVVGRESSYSKLCFVELVPEHELILVASPTWQAGLLLRIHHGEDELSLSESQWNIPLHGLNCGITIQTLEKTDSSDVSETKIHALGYDGRILATTMVDTEAGSSNLNLTLL
jgi:WD40 repeat protein